MLTIDTEQLEELSAEGHSDHILADYYLCVCVFVRVCNDSNDRGSWCRAADGVMFPEASVRPRSCKCQSGFVFLLTI